MIHRAAIVLGIAAAVALGACSGNADAPDASGVFEAVETTISAETAGRIEWFDVREGQEVDSNQLLAVIDTVQLALRKRQLEAQIGAVLRRRPDVATQIAAVQEQLRAAQRERDRVQRLRAADAATPKQLDDATSAVDVLQRQLDALRASLGLTVQSLEGDAQPLSVQIEQIDDQLRRSRITAPMQGTVLATYAERYEVTAPGRPMLLMANMTTMTLRAYVSGGQYPSLRIGQRVTVLVDRDEESQTPYTGTIQWISSKAEFTPKTIQTKDERANLVYAVKIAVPNDGRLKIGMYGDVRFAAQDKH
ncbi:MAG: HlyD family efflux transporter periplasmic adaptor subunit [Candidatus Kapabacteria bacterium]|nr:HlyD family efflux transporter periplasmic adaptor subunit [Candidatus Kapabacteria bacterium]